MSYSAAPSLAFRAVFEQSRACGLVPIPIEVLPGEDGKLKVHVVFTNAAETLHALKCAASLCASLPAAITLLLPLTVPYPLPLEESPVALDFICRRISELVGAVGATSGFTAYVYLCRNPIETVLKVLGAHALVMIGLRHRWSLGKSRRMARILRQNGHEVVLAFYG
ncbi:MAG TPA: hypothetical protein VFR18_06285 [Terriglobia bacterium]|nr:hypothetical protein [Terriglobia bacterium]